MIRDAREYNATVAPNTRELERLQEALPGYFASDGSFMIDRLEQTLRADEVKLSREGYELKFLGKSYAKFQASTKTETVVVPDVEHNEQPENAKSENLYIVGDNLDALKHLVNSYSGRVKCIYIDPPYNTGSDGFVYNDNFGFTADQLVDKLGIDPTEAKRLLDMHGKSSHSAWLTFMLPRLLLARELLTDDGVIFISIDENEQANLKQACNDVFGEQNLIGDIVWKGRGGGQDATKFVKAYELILGYAASADQFRAGRQELALDESDFPNFDDERNMRYKRQLARKWGSNDRRIDRPNLYFGVTAPDGTVVYPRRADGSDGNWRHARNRLMQEIEDGDFEFVGSAEDGWTLYEKVWMPDGGIKSAKYGNLIDWIPGGQGTTEVKGLFDGLKAFDFPKPSTLVNLLLRMAGVTESDFVLDFFSGSATTAHAVMQLNAEAGGNRKYILVQLPEEIHQSKPAYEAGYRTIDEIGRERIRRAAQKLKEETGADIDGGFKLVRLEQPSQKVITELESFDPEHTADLFADDMTQRFGHGNASGHQTLLTTWMNDDGYGLHATAESVRLVDYDLDVCDDTAYIIRPGFTSQDAERLVQTIESGQLRITRIVIFGYNIEYSVKAELVTNLKNPKSNNRVEVLVRF